MTQMIMVKNTSEVEDDDEFEMVREAWETICEDEFEFEDDFDEED